MSFTTLRNVQKKTLEQVRGRRMVLELLIALFYWNSTDCENAAPPPIHNLDCTLECAAGI
jgi:hypothetical protein